MSLFSSMLQPVIERELKSLEPEIASFMIKTIRDLSNEVIVWAEQKLNVDLNKDGTIGEPKDEA